MKSIALLLTCALSSVALVTGTALARPVVVEESSTIARPNASWTYFGRFGVALDGDFALVSGERYVADPATPGVQRHEGAAFLYRRSGTGWAYTAQLGPTVR